MFELIYRAVVRLVSAEDHEVEVGSQSRSELVVGVNICHHHELGDLVWKCDLEGLVEAGDAVLRVEVAELNAVEIYRFRGGKQSVYNKIISFTIASILQQIILQIQESCMLSMIQLYSIIELSYNTNIYV
ncbi:Hypothetical_protein [Hexamita inflata]|uniref:Hypothetical_protein n=1 Tax=Hexamita inflata TaxID=28002 RepID=A0AA86RQ41_9EUKA|nr:Hypothetical protein HINF_LOCUS63682 [Hexamita inflata]